MFFPTISTSKKMFFFSKALTEKGIARHIDASSVVWILIANSKLANQITRLAAIVVRIWLRSIKRPKYYYSPLDCVLVHRWEVTPPKQERGFREEKTYCAAFCASPVPLLAGSGYNVSCNGLQRAENCNKLREDVVRLIYF